MSTVPYSRHQTLNTTAIVMAPRKRVWPVIRALDRWSDFQDWFAIELVGGTGQVEVGQDLIIMSKGLPATMEQINEIVEFNRICWTVNGFSFLDDAINLPMPDFMINSARCIELFDHEQGTEIHNWISQGGLLAPPSLLFTGGYTKYLFNQFNQEVVNLF